MRLAILTGLLMSLLLVADGDSLGAFKGRHKVHPSSTIHFSVAQMGGHAVEGHFLKFSGQFVLAGESRRLSSI
jgi:polyisoprenoid-binding protein YceI